MNFALRRTNPTFCTIEMPMFCHGPDIIQCPIALALRLCRNVNECPSSPRFSVVQELWLRRLGRRKERRGTRELWHTGWILVSPRFFSHSKSYRAWGVSLAIFEQPFEWWIGQKGTEKNMAWWEVSCESQWLQCHGPSSWAAHWSKLRLVTTTEIQIGWKSPRKIIKVTCGDKIERKLHGAQLVLANLSLTFCTIHYSKLQSSRHLRHHIPTLQCP